MLRRAQTQADYDAVRFMDRELFGEKYAEPIEGRLWWVVREGLDWCAYAGLKLLANESYAFLCRAGVMPAYRGLGIQKRLISARVAEAKRQGLRGCLSYTSIDNPKSSNSLIAQGFKLYTPEHAWVGREFLYWIKEF